MSADRPFKDNKIFTEEMCVAARARLLEKLAPNCGNESEDAAEATGEAQMISSDDEGDEQNIDDLLPFTLAEQQLIEKLAATVRERMVSASPETLKQVAAFLYALERLPYATPDVSLDFAIMDRVDGNLSYVSVELDGQSFRLSTGGSVYSPDVGSDSFSETTFEIETGGLRDGSTEAFIDWLDAFVSADGLIEIQGDDDTDLTELAPDDGWDRLATYWESHWDDSDGW